MADRKWLKTLLARAVPRQFQGVTKHRISETLQLIDRATADMVDAVFALLDDTTRSAFSGVDAKFCEGATTAQIAEHVGRFQRGGTKLDREGRDYWIKPLRELGAIEPVYLDPTSKKFVAGHPVAKSPNSAYRLEPSFVAVLKAPPDEWQQLGRNWIRSDRHRERLSVQAAAATKTRESITSDHHDLIEACQQVYVPRFLAGYEVVYVDDGDGDRITAEQCNELARAGVALTLADAMPDILLWNPSSDSLWAVEAVTSDGEVDVYKVEQLTTLAGRCGKEGIGFTTAYPTWSVLKTRQAAHKNLAPETYVWVREDAGKHFLAVDERQELLLIVPMQRGRP